MIHYNILVYTLFHDFNWNNESTLSFFNDGKCLCIIRRDPSSAMIGTSLPSYTQWKWHDSTNFEIGGPDMLMLPDGNVIVAGRLYNNEVHTSLLSLDLGNFKLNEILKPPSGGEYFNCIDNIPMFRLYTCKKFAVLILLPVNI